MSLVAILTGAAACQRPLASEDAGTTDTGSQSDATGVDVPPTDGADPHAALSYTPTGCNYTVQTATGTVNNRMGDMTTFGAMPDPLRAHVSFASDPSTTAAVVWATADGDTLATVVKYGTSMTSLSTTAVGHVSSTSLLATAAHLHEVHLCGLTPDTTYYYQVGGEGHFSAIQSFRTAPAPGTASPDVNFVVAGDSRDSFTTWNQVQQQIMSTAGSTTPDFFVFSGDAVQLGTDQGAWNQWFDNATPTMVAMPYITAHGNHDALSVNYLAQFAQPQSSDPVQSELYFSLNYGPIHFVVLNDTPPNADYAGVVQGTEKTWMAADLAAVDRTQTPWVIVVHHKPPFSSSNHSNDTDTLLIRAQWAPVFAQYNVDMVFNGHDHDFEVTQPLRGDGTVAGTGTHGVVYFTAAGAGAQLYPSNTSPFTRHSESVVNFVMVHATDTTLVATPYRSDGTTIAQGVVTLTR